MMARFFDNVTGGQKLILIFGIIVLFIAARALFPEEAQWLRGWTGDVISAGKDLLQGGTP